MPDIRNNVRSYYRYLDTFLKVFSQLPQRIVWKWNEKPIQNLPGNVLLKKWLPQQDILGIWLNFF